MCAMQTVRVSSGDRVQVSVFRLPNVEFAAHSLQASLGTYTKQKMLDPNAPLTLIDAKALSAHLQGRFGHQVGLQFKKHASAVAA